MTDRKALVERLCEDAGLLEPIEPVAIAGNKLGLATLRKAAKEMRNAADLLEADSQTLEAYRATIKTDASVIAELREALTRITRIELPKRDNAAWRECVSEMKKIANTALKCAGDE